VDRERIIYSINIEDVQTVAMDELDRELTDEELEIVEREIGDYFHWHDAISFCIMHHITLPKKENLNY